MLDCKDMMTNHNNYIKYIFLKDIGKNILKLPIIDYSNNKE